MILLGATEDDNSVECPVDQIIYRKDVWNLNRLVIRLSWAVRDVQGSEGNEEFPKS